MVLKSLQKVLFGPYILETTNAQYLNILLILFGYKNLFLLFFNPWFERGEREVAGFRRRERNIVDANLSHQNVRSLYQIVPFNEENSY